MVTSTLLAAIPNILHGFGDTSKLVPEALRPYWDARPDKRQVHGTRSVTVTEPRQAVGDADGVYTGVPGIPVSVITADCVPLLMARSDGRMAAALHAGWRGLYGGAVGQLWAGLRERGEDPSAWVAAIGPCICAKCYEVSEELADDFKRRYQALPEATVVPTFRHLDLRAVAQYELQQAGLSAIEQVGGCNCCSLDADGVPRFPSYRRGVRGSRFQQHSGLVIESVQPE